MPAGCRAPLRLAVVVDAVLAALDPGDGLAGVLPGGPLGGLARHAAQGLLGVGEVVGAAVVLDGGGGLSPGQGVGARTEPQAPAQRGRDHHRQQPSQVGGDLGGQQPGGHASG